jgi:uncharacterized protein
MISPFRKANAISKELDEFFDLIDTGTQLFDEGVSHYFSGNIAQFSENICKIRQAEKRADKLLKEVEHALYKYSLMPELRTDVMRLMQRVDDIQDTMKEVLVQFEVERPYIPEELFEQLAELTKLCMCAAKEANAGARLFFRNAHEAKPRIEKAIELEQLADNLAESIKHRFFHDMHNLSLPEKFHLRYFTLHIESVSDIAKSIAYTLNLMLIKRFEQ